MFGGEDKMFGVGLTKFLVSVESTNRDLIGSPNLDLGIINM